MEEIITRPSLNFEDKNDKMGEDDPNANREPLSPNSQTNMEDDFRNIVSIKKGKATREMKDGQWQLEYILSDKTIPDDNLNARSEDPSQLYTIRGPEHVEACLDLLHFLTKSKEMPACGTKEIPAFGTVFDENEISLSGDKLYRNKEEFQITDKILGTGISGDVLVVKDETTGREHGLKTVVMISTCAENEVRCWVDLNDSGFVPRMFLFQFVNNKIEIHMQIIKGKTLTSIMDEYLYKPSGDHNLVKPFVMHVLDRSIEAISAMHRKGLAHNDLHGGNLMLDSSMQVKVIDFGSATKENANMDKHDQHSKKNLNDYKELLRVISGLYIGNTFNDVYDFQKNYKEGFEMLSPSDKYEFISLIDTVVKYGNINQLRSDVKQQLNNVFNKSNKGREQILHELAKLMFPERFQQIHLSEQVQQMKTDESDEETEADCIDCNDVEPCSAAPDIDKVAASKLLAEVLGKFGIGQF